MEPQFKTPVTARIRGSDRSLPPFGDRNQLKTNDKVYGLTPPGVFFLAIFQQTANLKQICLYDSAICQQLQLADWIKNSRDTGDTLRHFQSFLSSGNDMEQLFLYSCQETGFYQDGNVWESQVHEFTAELDRGGDLLDEIAGTGAEDPGENSEPASASEAAAPVDLGALYENDELTVSGTLEERYYEIDTQNTGTVYILQLDKPFTVQLYADWMEYNGETVEIDEIQIDFQNQGLNRFYLNRHINVTGTVMYGHTGHHQTIILLMDAILNTSGS